MLGGESEIAVDIEDEREESNGKRPRNEGGEMEEGLT